MILPNCICENASGSVSNASEGPIKGLTLELNAVENTIMPTVMTMILSESTIIKD